MKNILSHLKKIKIIKENNEMTFEEKLQSISVEDFESENEEKDNVKFKIFNLFLL